MRSRNPPASHRCRARAAGVTLIELLIAVAIVAVLAAVAYPAYQDQIRKSRRAEAQSLLMNVGSRQQQMLLDTRNYAGTLADLKVPVPGSLALHYTVTLQVTTTTLPAFTATAAPLGAQARDKCGTLSLVDNGVKAPTGCW